MSRLTTVAQRHDVSAGNRRPCFAQRTANQAIDSVMRRLAMKKAVCSSTLILPLHPLRSAQFRRCHRQLIVSLFDLGQRLESPSEPQTWAFRSDSVHQQNRIHSMARLTPRTMRIPLDAERLLLAQRNRQQSPQTIHRVRLCDGCGHRESRQSQMSQGSDRGLFAGGRSARGALGVARAGVGSGGGISRRQISKARAMSSSAF